MYLYTIYSSIMLAYKIIHIAPFDIGCSFFDYEQSIDQSKKELIKSLGKKCEEIGFIIIPNNNRNYLLVVKLNEYVSCYLLECGVGVFVLRNLELTDLTAINRKFDNNLICQIYYRKKIEQQSILDANDIRLNVIHKFMEIVWQSMRRKDRPYSASVKYKHRGLSYILSVYHIIDNKQSLNKTNETSLDILMNPSAISKIADSSQWDSIKEKLPLHINRGYDFVEYNNDSKVAASWSAVAVVEEKETDCINEIIEYEIILQASWFLFDCIIDNIKKNILSNLSLQREKSLITNVYLEISTILSANMNSNKKNTYELIYKTSGFDSLKNKLFLLLENRIAIARAKISERQGIYGIITEILLVLFTLVSIFEPLKKLILGTIESVDIIVGGIMIVVFIICSILIIGKERSL